MERLERKQTTVMNADVAGFSRLMAEDDAATLDALLKCLDRIRELVERFGGRVVDAPGDNVLAEFPSELEALRCALEVQRGNLERRSESLMFRIGLHSGWLIEKSGRLYGNVVNLAARLQSAATPGRVLLSDRVAERIGDAFDNAVQDAGRQQFKNIPYTVQTFDVGPA